MKNDKINLIIWATVALVIGVVIGAFLIGPMTTTGNAKIITQSAITANQDNGTISFYGDDGDTDADGTKKKVYYPSGSTVVILPKGTPGSFNLGVAKKVINPETQDLKLIVKRTDKPVSYHCGCCGMSADELPNDAVELECTGGCNPCFPIDIK
jgi:hypothetical protein